MRRFSTILLYVTIAFLLLWQFALVLQFLCRKARKDSLYPVYVS